MVHGEKIKDICRLYMCAYVDLLLHKAPDIYNRRINS